MKNSKFKFKNAEGDGVHFSPQNKWVPGENLACAVSLEKPKTGNEAVNMGSNCVFEAAKIISLNTAGPHYNGNEAWDNARMLGKEVSMTAGGEMVRVGLRNAVSPHPGPLPEERVNVNRSTMNFEVRNEYTVFGLDGAGNHSLLTKTGTTDTAITRVKVAATRDVRLRREPRLVAKEWVRLLGEILENNLKRRAVGVATAKENQ